ncbi:MAG: glycoside hydrolase family 10 protein [Thermoanaerobaculia bacterium]
MRSGLLIALAAVTTACVSFAAPAPAPAAAAPEEVRALWVVRSSITSPEDVDKVVADAKSGGFNTLIVQVRGRGDAYYASRWEPRAVALAEQPASFDPLRRILDLAHAEGMTVHAWLNTVFLANIENLPPQPDHAWNAHPDWIAVPRAAATELATIDPADPRYRERIIEVSKRDMSELEGLYVAPSHPAVKEHIYNVFIDVVENYDVDGIHFDYVRLPSPDFDYSPTALARFRAEIEATLSDEERRLFAALAATRPLLYVETYPEAWDRFRRAQITEIVERIYTGVKARKPDVLVSAAVFANDVDALERRFQDWKHWLELGLLDVVCPMAYTVDVETWKRQIAIARGFAFGGEVWAGIGAYRQSPENTVEKIELARRMGADGFVLFSYGSLVRPSQWAPEGDALSRIAPAVTAGRGAGASE